MRLPLVSAVSALCALSAGWGNGAAGQATRTCFVEVDSTGGNQRQVAVGGGYVRWFSGGGVWAHCRGEPTSWYSDSVAWFQDQDRFDMIGRVNFRDATAELTSQRASYFLGQERLDATGDARLRNRVTGSVLRGPVVRYYRRIPGMREQTLLAAPRRPTIEYRSEGDSAGAEPYLIVADSVQFRGNTAAAGWGTVTIDRSDFHARGDSATLDTGERRGRLMSRAGVRGGEASSYRLTGRDIRFRLAEDRSLSWVQAEGEADGVSAEWHLRADTIQFDVRADRIQRGTAWGDSLRPEAVSATMRLAGDSLAIVSPDQVLDQVRAVGAAIARSLRDSLDTDPDWVAGDTVTARFTTSASGGRTLEEIHAVGAARARYRVYAEGRAGDLPDINYLRGDRILARFAEERLLRVDGAGAVDGVYVEAPRRVP